MLTMKLAVRKWDSAAPTTAHLVIGISPKQQRSCALIRVAKPPPSKLAAALTGCAQHTSAQQATFRNKMRRSFIATAQRAKTPIWNCVATGPLFVPRTFARLQWCPRPLRTIFTARTEIAHQQTIRIVVQPRAFAQASNAQRILSTGAMRRF